MPEESSTKASLQEAIDKHLKQKDPSYSFVIVDKEGECSVLENLNIRFFSCKFKSFSAKKNNIFYFKNCDFQEGNFQFRFVNSIVIAEQCTFNNRIILENSRLELLNCTIKQTLDLKNKSILLSKRSQFQKNDNGSAITNAIKAENSKIELIKDIIFDWKEIFNLKSSTFKANNLLFKTTSDTETILYQKTSKSEFNGFNNFTISSGKILFNSDSSTLDIINFDTINVTSDTIFNLKNSTLNIKKGKKLINTKQIFNSNDSIIKLSNIDKIQGSNTDPLLTFINSTVELQKIGIFQNTGSVFDLTNSKLYLFGSGVEKIYSSSNISIVLKDSSKLYIANIDSIASDSVGTINCKTSLVDLTNIKELIGGYVIEASENSKINLNKVDSLKGTGTTINLLSNSKGSILNTKLINGDTPISCNTGAVINLESIEDITGNTIAIKLDGGSKGILSHINQVFGVTTGIDVSDNSTLNVNRIIDFVKGNTGIDIKQNSTARIYNTVVKGLSSNGISVDTSNLEIKESTIDGSNYGISLIGNGYFASYKCYIENSSITGAAKALSGSSYYIQDLNNLYNGDIILDKCNHISNGISVNTINIQNSISKEDGILINSTLDIQDNSVVSLNKTEIISDINMASSCLYLLSTKIASITLSDSYLSTHVTNMIDITPSGKSFTFGGPIIAGSFIPANDDTYVDPSGILMGSGGNVGIQADDDIILEANNISFGTSNTGIRNNIIGYVVNNFDLTINNDAIMTISNDMLIDLSGGNDFKIDFGSSYFDMTASASDWVVNAGTMDFTTNVFTVTASQVTI